ncbi:M23 family metallopeptidase [Halocella sp. SP3-1]|nr:M23 family metallopeptidase [Halocella sp. SP3-1]
MMGVIIMDYKLHIIMILLLICLMSTLVLANTYTTYTIKKGDTLSLIANSFNIKTEEIIKINNIKNPDLILVGEKIRIPSEGIKYTVKSGDSLWKIAQSFKVKLQQIINLNRITKPGIIYTGQKLIIPVTNDRTRYQLASRAKSINYIWPVQGRISSEYGWRIHPIRKKREFHTGLDIAVPYGTPVYAAEDGIVEFSSQAGGYGKLVIIRHQDNSKTYYGHNLLLKVNKGDRVKQGKVIALSGNSGTSTGPHLHFEIRINNKHCNPLQYLNKRYLNNGFKI